MRRAWKAVVWWLLMLPLLILILFPFAVMLSTAVKPADEVFTYPPRWLPGRLEFANFARMWTDVGFGVALINSLAVSLGSTLVCVVVAIPAAFALARLRFIGKGAFRQFLLITQMLSPVVLIIGLFRLMASMGLVDELWSLILAYAAFNLAFATWMLQSYFQSIPRELDEAARIDGARWHQRLWYVQMPLAAPALGVTAIFTFVNAWNEFVLALTLVHSEDKLTLPVRIFALVGGAYHVDWQIVMAATLLTTAPVAVMFCLLQSSMTRGLTLGAVK